MPLKRTNQTDYRRDWPTTMSHLAYVCAGLAFILVAVQFWLYSLHYNRVFASDAISAVTLTNGQTYFGRMEKFGAHTVVLFNPYYLQVNPTDGTATDATIEETTATNPEAGLQLKKLSDDFHQPNDYLIVNRDEVLYWQHLNSSSPIIEAMVEYEQ